MPSGKSNKPPEASGLETATTSNAIAVTTRFDDELVVGCFTSYSRKINEQLEKIKDAIDTLGRAAAIASKLGSQGDKERAREAAEQLIVEHRELKFVLDAMVYLASKGNKQAYCISAEATDFQALIEDTVVQLKAEERQPFSTADHPLMKVFLSNAAEEDAIEQIDDDIQVKTVGTSSFKNMKCPLSLRDVKDLKEPVEDSHGFIYEKENLLLYMSQVRPDRHGRFACPEAASGTTFTKEEIKPAEAVLRLRKNSK